MIESKLLTDDEPQQRSLVTLPQCRIETIDNEQGDGKFDGASCEEDAQKLGDRPFISKVANDVCLKRVEGMRRSILGQLGDVRKDVRHGD